MSKSVYSDSEARGHKQKKSMNIIIRFPLFVSSKAHCQAEFMPECAIAGVLRWNQRLPTETRKKGQFGPFLLQDCKLNTGIVF